MALILRQYRTRHGIFGIWHLPNVKVLYPSVGRGRDSSWYIRTNSIGIRDDREFAITKKKRVNRILLFGDSYTFGSGIDVEYRYSNLLEQKIKNLEIINFGVGSTGVHQHFLIYKHLGINYEANILMINPYLNNIARCTGPYEVYQDRDRNIIKIPKPYFILEDNQLVLKNVPVPKNYFKKELDSNKKKNNKFGQHLFSSNPYGNLRDKLIKKFFINTLYKYWFIKLFPIQPYPEFRSHDHPYWILGRKVLEKFIETSKQKTIIITPLPSWSIIMNPKLAIHRERFHELHNPVRRILIIDILPYFLKLKFKDRRKCFISKYDHHYSEFGHRVVADGLYSEFKKLNIFNAL